MKGFDEKWYQEHIVKKAGASKRVLAPSILPSDLPCPLEEVEQVTLAQFLDLMMPGDWFHVPNGGIRPSKEDKNGVRVSVEAKKMKAQGVKKGVPDVWIIRPIMGAPGVVIELKRRKGGTVSPEQKEWLERLKSYNWIIYVAKGADEAIQFVRDTYGI